MTDTFEPRFKIGQTIWHATFDSHEKWVPCPHCRGHKYAVVIFGDGQKVSVDCPECSLGFNSPTGLVRLYEREPQATSHEIIGVNISRNNQGVYAVEYTLDNHHIVAELDCFDDETSAREKAAILAAKWAEEDKQRILEKEKPTRSWAQNAAYHRSALTRAQHEVDYHTRKLSVAQVHAKEDRKRGEKQTTITIEREGS